MKLKIFPVIIGVILLCASKSSLEASYTFINGRFVDDSKVATLSVQEHFNAGAAAIEACNWDEAMKQFYIVSASFPETVYGQEAYYYLGISYFYLEEYDFANEAFEDYLNLQANPRFFQETIQYKLAIAERFSQGAKRRFFGTKQLPKWASGKGMALEIYDQVIAAVPCHEMAAQALMSKAYLLWERRDYRGAVEALQAAIRRFPKYEGVPDCYLLISKIYVEQSGYEFQNPDILAFAQINLERFARDFPREERLNEVSQDILSIKEMYAQGLCETAQFYERIRKRHAAMIYYDSAIQQFPETCVAVFCRQRMLCLNPNYQDNSLNTIANEAIDEEDGLVDLAE